MQALVNQNKKKSALRKKQQRPSGINVRRFDKNGKVINKRNRWARRLSTGTLPASETSDESHSEHRRLQDGYYTNGRTKRTSGLKMQALVNQNKKKSALRKKQQRPSGINVRRFDKNGKVINKRNRWARRLSTETLPASETSDESHSE